MKERTYINLVGGSKVTPAKSRKRKKTVHSKSRKKAGTGGTKTRKTARATR